MRRILLLIPLFFLMSCAKKKTMYAANYQELQLQVMGKPTAEGSFEYNVRIFHAFKGSDAQQLKLNEKMSYRMDSAFFFNNGIEKKYADEIIPVANGIKNCFEYVVIFNEASKKQDSLIYKDKYITGETYQLSAK